MFYERHYTLLKRHFRRECEAALVTAFSVVHREVSFDFYRNSGKSDDSGN